MYYLKASLFTRVVNCLDIYVVREEGESEELEESAMQRIAQLDLIALTEEVNMFFLHSFIP